MTEVRATHGDGALGSTGARGSAETASKRPVRRSTGVTWALAALAATDLILAEPGGFPLALFWPAWLLAVLASSGRQRMPGDSRLLRAWQAAAMLMAVSAAATVGASKPTSLVLSAMFMAFGWWCARQRPGLSPQLTLKLLHGVLLAYAVTTLLAMLLLALGASESPVPALIKWTYDKNADAFRLQGLSSEPSYAALVVGAAWLAVMRLERLRPRVGLPSKHRIWRAMVPWTVLLVAMMLAFLSVYGYLILLLALSALMPRGRHPGRQIAVFAAALLALAWLASRADPDSRLLQIAGGIGALDLDSWMLADGSSFMRVGPLFHYLMSADPLSPGFWLGHGAASSTQFFGEAFGGLAGKDVETIQTGFVPAFLHDWGLLAALAVARFCLIACRGPHAVQARLVFVMMLFNANLNTLLFWWVVAAMLVSSPLPQRSATRRASAAGCGTKVAGSAP